VPPSDGVDFAGDVELLEGGVHGEAPRTLGARPGRDEAFGHDTGDETIAGADADGAFLLADLIEPDAGTRPDTAGRKPALDASRNRAAGAADRVVRHDVGIDRDDQRHGAVDRPQSTIEGGADTNLAIEADVPARRAHDDRGREVTGNDTNPYRSHDAETTEIDVGVSLAELAHGVGVRQSVHDLDRRTDMQP